MPSLNKVQIIGRLGADPEERVTAKGTKYAAFSVAVNRFWKGADGKTNKETDWFKVESWGKTGEICLKLLSKGSLVYISGRLQTDRYEHEGETRFFTKVIAQKMQMLDRKDQPEEPEMELEEAG